MSGRGMELLEALEAVLAQNSCICHAAGMPAVEPALQIELFQIRPISIKCQLKFIRGRRKTKHSDPGETRAALWWLQNGNAEIPLLLEVLMLLPGSLSGLGLCFLQLQVLPEQLQVLPKAPRGSTSMICHQQGGWLRNLCRGLEPGILHRVPGLRMATPDPSVVLW